MDWLAKNGANFVDAHTSFPLCCPFRASIMTGLYAHKHGMYSNHYPLDLTLDYYLPEMMKEAGYRTGWIGKWHLNGGKKFDIVPKEYRLGFDEFIGYSRGHHYIDAIYYRDDDPTPCTSERFEPEFQTDQLIDFMERAVNDDKPFLGMICYGIPHPPVDMQPDESKYKYSPDQIELPDTVPAYMKDKAKTFRGKYYGLVNYVDREIGKITDYLKEKGIFEDTVFIIVSDHGEMAGEFGLYEKIVSYRASSQVPLIINYPRMIKEGTVVEQLIDPSVDIVPTILDVCGISVPEVMQGQSLKTMLKNGEDDAYKDYVYYQALEVADHVCEVVDKEDKKPFGQRGFRTKEYLYVEIQGKPFKLFDLKNDPEEKYNRVDDFTYYSVLKEQRARLNNLMKENDDSWDLRRDMLPPDFETHQAALDRYNELLKRAKHENM
jgi:arylsulfatase A-like enzyme